MSAAPVNTRPAVLGAGDDVEVLQMFKGERQGLRGPLQVTMVASNKNAGE